MNQFRYILRLYNHHQAVQMLPFQGIQTSIQDLDDLKARKHRHHAVFPFLIVLTICIDTGIQYFRFPNDPDVEVFHRVMMREFVPAIFMRQGAMVFCSVYGMIIVCNLFLIFDRFVHLDFILLSTSGQAKIKQLPVQMMMPFRKKHLRHVPDELSAKLARFYQPFHRRTRLLMRLMSFECDLAFFVPLCLIHTYKSYISNWEYLPSGRVIIYTLISLFYFRSMVQAIGIGFYFIGENGIIQIRQRFYLSRLNRKRKFVVSFVSVQKGYRTCFKSMGNVLDLTLAIERFGQFYSRYVTALILVYGTASVSALHAIVRKGSQAAFFQVAIWACYSACDMAFIFLFNFVSSRTIYLNFRLFKQLRQLQIGVLSGRAMLSRWQIVKLNLVNEYKVLLQKCGFRLLNSATINNKLFAFQIFGCVSVFYMKLVREEPVE